MQPEVAAQFWMKAKCNDSPLPYRHRVAIVHRHHMHVANAFDQRRADEDAGKCFAVEPFYVKGRLEAFDLPAVSVAAHTDVEQAEAALVGHSVGDVPREQDHPRTGGKRRKPTLNCVTDRFEQAYFLRALERENWNQSRAARSLGIHRNTLIARMTAWGIRRVDEIKDLPEAAGERS